MALITYSNRLFGFLTTLILAKFLEPEHFGLVAIASIVIESLNIFKDLGIGQALIYHKEKIEEASNTSFFIIVGFQTSIFIIAAIVAPFAADFYNNELVMPVLIILSTNFIWQSLKAVPTALFKKNIDFKKLVIPELIPVIIGSALGIYMAIAGYGVWSLVFRTISINFLGMILMYFVSPFRPQWKFDKQIAKELFHYGKYIVGTSVFLVALYNVDKFFVSTFIGIAALGFYELAMRIANLPVSELSHIVGSVMFPVFSKLNTDTKGLTHALLKTVGYSSSLSIPMAVGIALYGPSLIISAYGEKWAEMAMPLQILSFYALFRSLSSVIYDGFKALGFPKEMQKFVITRLVMISVLGIPVSYYFGLIGISILVVFTYVVVFLFEMAKLEKILNISVVNFLKVLSFPTVVSITLLPAIFFSIKYLVQEITIIYSIIGIGLSVAGYVLVQLIFNKQEIKELKKLVFSKN